MKVFYVFFHAIKNNCWKYCKWKGDALVCQKCGEVIALRHPKIFNSKEYDFCPLVPQAVIHKDEIIERCGLNK